MQAELQQEIKEIHDDVEQIKETVSMLADRYIEEQHRKVQEKDAFISLGKYKRKRAIPDRTS